MQVRKGCAADPPLLFGGRRSTLVARRLVRPTDALSDSLHSHYHERATSGVAVLMVSS